MTALTDALADDTVLNIEAVIYDRDPRLVQPYLDVVAAARRVADAPEVLYCSNHHQLGNELWCSHGRIWDKDCRMVRRLLVDPGDNQQEDE